MAGVLGGHQVGGKSEAADGGRSSFVGSSAPASHMQRMTSDERSQFLQLGTDSVAREMGNFPFEEVLCLPLDQEIVWRRSAVANPDSDLYGSSHSSSGNVHVLERPKLEKSYLTDGTNIFTTGVVLPGSSATSSSCSLKVPRKPMLLMRTHFVCDSEIDVIVSNINHILSGIVDLSCEFNMESLSWQALYLRGSCQCKLQVSIYCNSGDNSGYLVETNRLSGESEGCRMVHAQLRRVLGCAVESSPRPQFDSYAASLPPTSPDVPTDAEARELLQPVLRMARDSKIDSKVLAAKIFCDLSTNEAMQQALCDTGCLGVLIELMAADSPLEVRQYSLVALARLSAPIAYQEALIDAGVVPMLLSLEVDGSFETAELRREGVRILANLTARFGAKVVDAACHESLTTWMESMNQIHDGRLKMHADRACEVFSTLLISTPN